MEEIEQRPLLQQIQHCFYFALTQELARIGHHTSEREACVLSSNLGFGVSIVQERADIMPSIRLAGVSLSPYKLKQAFDARVKWHCEDDAGSAWRVTNRLLSQGRSQVIAADIFYIPHLREHYGRHHFPHFLCLVGNGAEGYRVEDINFAGVMPHSLLGKARSNPQLDLAHLWWEVVARTRSNGGQVDLQAALIDGFNTAMPLSRPDLEPGSKSLRRDAHGFDGRRNRSFEWAEPAVRLLMNSLETCARTADEVGLARIGNSMYYQMMHDVVIPRRLFAEVFVDLVRSHSRTSVLANLCEQTFLLLDRWRIVATLLLKGFLYTRPATLLMPRIAERLASVVEEDKHHWLSLYDGLRASERFCSRWRK